MPKTISSEELPSHLSAALRELRGRAFEAGLFLDVDGTLSRIAPTPAGAEVTIETRMLVNRLAEHYRLVAVVSGRPAAQAKAMVGCTDAVYAGNHGLELLLHDELEPVVADLAPHLPRLEALREALADHPLAKLPGVLLEEKGMALSLHYRQSPDELEEQIVEGTRALAREYGLALWPGRKVAEFRPAVEVTKGTAVRELVRRYDVTAAMAIGDDLTDVNAFDAIRELAEADVFLGFSIGVLAEGGRETPAEVLEGSDFRVHGTGAVETVLRGLIP